VTRSSSVRELVEDVCVLGAKAGCWRKSVGEGAPPYQRSVFGRGCGRGETDEVQGQRGLVL
jgi:hypothetical protein